MTLFLSKQKFRIQYTTPSPQFPRTFGVLGMESFFFDGPPRPSLLGISCYAPPSDKILETLLLLTCMMCSVYYVQRPCQNGVTKPFPGLNHSSFQPAKPTSHLNSASATSPSRHRQSISAVTPPPPLLRATVLSESRLRSEFLEPGKPLSSAKCIFLHSVFQVSV